MVFYRKYRPQTIEELDSSDVRNKLTSFLSKKSSIHALLFTGPKGLGKTSAARIVAKVVNCEKISRKQTAKSHKLSVEPCNKCSQCVSITNGTNIDVLEIDGASNRGIDEIRDLREKVRLSPAGSFKKVYIIDEVHMLTTEAFNALLKTLEEPPSHVIFILCTTEPHKVPPTIASRCFQIAFRKATKEELVRSFTRIVKREKISIDKNALESISDLSDGSFRDGVKILEEIYSSAGNKKITKELVEKKFQISNISSHLDEMLNLLTEKNTKKTIQLVGELTSQGIDMKYFIEQLIFKLHELLLSKAGVLKDLKTDLSLNLQEIKELTELLVKANSQLKFAVLPQLPLEMVIVEWCEKGFGMDDLLPHPAIDAYKESAEVAPRIKTSDSDLWQRLIDKVKTQNHSIAGVLRGCSLKNYDGKKFVIEAKFKFHKEKLDEHKTRELLKKVSGDIIGSRVDVLVVLKENPKY